MAATTASKNLVQKAYIAYYGRAADPRGLEYWAARVDSEGGLASVMNAFGTSAEATSLQSGLSNAAKVDAIYVYLFGRHADASGLDYYTTRLDNGTYTLATIAYNIIDGVRSGTDDYTIVANKLAAANSFTEAVDTAAEIVAYDGTAANELVRNWLSSVDATTTSVTTAQNNVVQTIGELQDGQTNPGSRFTLTSGSDYGSSFLGTSKDDTFLATTSGQLGSSDTINGGAGTDSLTATVSAATVAPTLTSIERLDITNGDSANASIVDATYATGITYVRDNTSTANLSVTNLNHLVDLRVSNATDGTTTIDYEESALAGSTDVMNITLDGSLASTGSIIVTADGTADLETVNVVSTRAANAGSAGTVLNLGDVDTTTVNFSGNKDLLIAMTGSTEAVTLNASAMTGKLNLTGAATTGMTITGGTGNDTLIGASGNDSINGGSGADTINGSNGQDTLVGGAGNDSIIGGTGNDSIDGGANDDQISFAQANLTTDDTVVGGTGNDTLLITNDADTTITAAMLTNVSVETLKSSAASTGYDVSLALTAAVKTSSGLLTLDASSVTDGLVTVDASTITSGLTVVSSSTGAGKITLGSGNDTWEASVAQAAVSANAVDLGTGVDTLRLSGASAAGTLDDGVTGFEILSFANPSTRYTITAGDTNVASGATLTVDGAAITTGVANEGLIFLGEDADGAYVINGTAFKDTLRGGSGADYIVGSTTGTWADSIDGGVGNDTLVGGSGADTILAGTGADSVVGGAGDDVLVVTAAGLGSTDVLSGGAGNDTLHFAAADSTVAAAALAGVSVETIQTANVTNAFSIGLNDAVVAAAGGTLTVDATLATDGAITVDAAAITTGNTVLNIDSQSATGAGLLRATLGAGNDTVLTNVTAAADGTSLVLNGGAGNDTLSLTGASTAVTLEGGITNFETLTFANASTRYTITASDTNVASGATLTVDGAAITTGVANEGLIFLGVESNGAYVINGTAFKDTLRGGSGADYIVGSTTGTWADSIDGGVGNDTIVGGSGADYILDGAGVDSVMGGAGADSVEAGSGFDYVNGGAGDDVFVGITQQSVGSTAYETIDGGAGNDTLYFAAGANTITVGDLQGVSNIEKIRTVNTTEAFTLGLNNAVLANNGGTISVDATGMTDGGLTLDAGSVTSGSIKLDVDSLTATGAAALAATLGSGNDTVYANITTIKTLTNVQLVGGAGNDTLSLTGASTSATFDTSITGFETLTFANPSTRYTITTVDETVASGVTFTVDGAAITTGVNSEGLIFLGTAETDGQFVINGTALKDTLQGGALADVIVGSTSGTAADSIDGGSGNDTITAGAGDDTVLGGSGADSIIGAAGADVISGETGNDTISAGSGADVITGGAGNDSLTGGTEADTFVYTAVTDSSTAGYDTVTDFVTGTDKLRFTLDYTGQSSGLNINANVISSGTGAAGMDAAMAALSGAKGETIYDTTNGFLYVNVSDSASPAVTTADYKIAITAATTAGTTVQDGDVNYVITGGSANDTITAGGGADTIDGGTGADSITGGAGDDSITAGTGADTIVGGAGNDTIVLGASGDIDTITFGATVSANGSDTISGFTSGADLLNLDPLLDGISKVYNEYANGTTDFTADNVIVIAGTTTIAAAATAIAADTDVVATTGLIVVSNGTDTFVYHSTDLAANGTETLIATIVGVASATSLATADFVFA